MATVRTTTDSDALAQDDWTQDDMTALQAAIAKMREQDRQDILEGKIGSQALSWFDRDYVMSLELIIPEYR